MQTWAILAAKHATLISGIGLGSIPAMSWDSVGGFAVGLLLAGGGFAVLNSSRRAWNWVPQPDVVRAGRPEARSHDGGRMARARRWVDRLLTGMLSDDTDLVTAVPESWGTDPQLAEQETAAPESWGTDPQIGEQETAAPESWGTDPQLAERETAEPATAGRDSAQPDRDQPEGGQPEWDQPEPELPGPAELAWSAERTLAPDPAARPRHAGASTSALAVPRQFEREQEPAGPRRRSDEGFWGLDEPGASASGNGYRSRHRQDEAASDSRAQDAGRGKPRHAAPPPSFGVTLGRRLTSPRLTSRSAAHAGG
jgi:hypothetical protein